MVGDVGVEAAQCLSGGRRAAGVVHEAEEFFGGPRGVELAGRVTGIDPGDRAVPSVLVQALRADQGDSADPIERIVSPSAVAEGGVVDPAAYLVQSPVASWIVWK